MYLYACLCSVWLFLTDVASWRMVMQKVTSAMPIIWWIQSKHFRLSLLMINVWTEIITFWKDLINISEKIVKGLRAHQKDKQAAFRLLQPTWSSSLSLNSKIYISLGQQKILCIGYICNIMVQLFWAKLLDGVTTKVQPGGH